MEYCYENSAMKNSLGLGLKFNLKFKKSVDMFQDWGIKINSKRYDGLSSYFPLWEIGLEPTFGTVQGVLYAIPF